MIVVIDSSEYKADRSFRKKELVTICELGKMKLIQLHIPWFVYKECTSEYLDSVSNMLKDIETRLYNLGSMGVAEGFQNTAFSIAKSINKLEVKTTSAVERHWMDFVKKSNAVTYTYDKEDSLTVFDEYFKAGIPFSSLKNRKDIPDAFIWQTVKKLSENGEVHFISTDQGLINRIKGEKNIVAHHTLTKFLESNDIKPIMEAYEKLLSETKDVDRIKGFVIDRLQALKSAILESIENHGEFFFFDDEIPSNGGIAYFRFDSKPRITIKKSKIEVIGDAVFFPFKVSSPSVYMYFYCLKDELPEIFRKNWDFSHHTQHFYKVEATVGLTLSASTSLNIDYIQDANELPPISIQLDNVEFY